MINIDETTYLIELTRGDDATVTFKALDPEGSEYFEVAGDVLTFAVGKRRNKEPLFQVRNEYGSFSEVEITADEFNAEPTKYFIDFNDGHGTMIRCNSEYEYDSNETYYISNFWDIRIRPEHTALMKEATYVWDLQLETAGEVNTIIGQTDSLNPKFKVWGEVSRREVSQ